MSNRIFWLCYSWSFLLLSILICPLTARAADYFDEATGKTLFAFDQISIPHTQNLKLEMHAPKRHSANPVVQRGAPGSVDAHGVQFYGSIIRESGKYRLWYVAFDDLVKSKIASARWRAAYAESLDGVTWTKPHLGLVQFAGNKDNNLLNMGNKSWGFVNLKVIKDEADPDPARRYKMTTHVYFRHHTRLGTLLPFVSHDGLTWKPVKEVTPVKGELKKEDLFIPGVHFEPCGGLYQWQGWYLINGQNALPGVHHYQGRVVRVYRSRDFVNWSPTSSIAFVRTAQHDYLGAGRSREGEQNHEGISVWDRRNVLLGIYGRWHGAEDWKDVSVDLGFVMSHDGLNFREPKHEWTFLKHGKDGEWDQGGVLQGQGFENIGEQTFVYYGAWDPRATGGAEVARGGIGIAVIPRDRFGTLRVDESGKGPGDYQLPEIRSEFITNEIEITKQPRFYLNADGLGAEASLKIELLNDREQPLPGYTAKVQSNGFQTPVVWQQNVSPLPDRIHIRVTFEGAQNTAIRFSALYIRP
jgi:hypothetical protein